MQLLRIFQYGNEFCRREKPVYGIDPPGQSFLTADGGGGAADDRLVIRPDVAFTDGFVNVVYDVFLTLELFAQGFRIETVLIIGVARHFVAGGLGQIAGHGGGDFRTDNIVDTGHDKHFVLFPQVQNVFM